MSVKFNSENKRIVDVISINNSDTRRFDDVMIDGIRFECYITYDDCYLIALTPQNFFIEYQVCLNHVNGYEEPKGVFKDLKFISVTSNTT